MSEYLISLICNQLTDVICYEVISSPKCKIRVVFFFFQLASIFPHPILLFVPSLQSTGDPEALNVRLRPLLEMVLFWTAEDPLRPGFGLAE